MQTWMVPVLLAVSVVAEAGADDVPLVQRERLLVVEGGPGGFQVVDGYGRPVSAERFSRSIGDLRTWEAARRAARRQSFLGSALVVLGPITLITGVSRIAVGDWREVTFMESAGYATVGTGLTATLGGIALLQNRTAREPSTWYDEAQATRLVMAYNLRIQGLFQGQRLSPSLELGPTSVGVAFRW